MILRGVCPICERWIRITASGRIGWHGSKEKSVWPPEKCSGMGKLPA